MKGQELRIGNLLYYKNTVDIAIVELIHKKHFDCRDEYGIFTPNGNYEPITLTEEWLLKFGFEKGRKYYSFNGFDVDDKGWIGFNSMVADCKVQYVHQLQNIYFALAGKELEAKP